MTTAHYMIPHLHTALHLSVETSLGLLDRIEREYEARQYGDSLHPSIVYYRSLGYDTVEDTGLTALMKHAKTGEIIALVPKTTPAHFGYVVKTPETIKIVVKQLTDATDSFEIIENQTTLYLMYIRVKDKHTGDVIQITWRDIPLGQK